MFVQIQHAWMSNPGLPWVLWSRARPSQSQSPASDGNKNFFTAAVSAEDLFAVGRSAVRSGAREMGSGRLMHHFAELVGRKEEGRKKSILVHPPPARPRTFWLGIPKVHSQSTLRPHIKRRPQLSFFHLFLLPSVYF